jgi:GNAT superfamily N-acetyltransferase
MNGTLRIGTAADRQSIQRLVNEAFFAERALKHGRAERLGADGREMDTLLQRGTFLVSEEHDTIVACVYVELRGQRSYVGLLSVAPTQRGLGLGRAMMQAAEAFARKEGCAWMDLRVVNPRKATLVPLYEHLGYVVSGTEPYPPALQELMLEPGHFLCMTKRI